MYQGEEETSKGEGNGARQGRGDQEGQKEEGGRGTEIEADVPAP